MSLCGFTDLLCLLYLHLGHFEDQHRTLSLALVNFLSFFVVQSLAMNAIGSESMSHLRQQAQGRNGSSSMLDINEFPALKSIPQSGGITSGITNGISS